MRKNIVLTGFMGAGKTAVGEILAKLAGLERIELDDEIVQKAGMSIPEIFETQGEGKFRDMETEGIQALRGRRGLVISTGGGAVMREQNMKALKQDGIVVYLKAEPLTILKRTSKDSDRPLLQVEDPLSKINELLARRMPFYERADISVDTEDKSPLEVAAEILTRLRWEKSESS